MAEVVTDIWLSGNEGGARGRGLTRQCWAG